MRRRLEFVRIVAALVIPALVITADRRRTVVGAPFRAASRRVVRGHCRRAAAARRLRDQDAFLRPRRLMGERLNSNVFG